MPISNLSYFASFAAQTPHAYAIVKGSYAYPNIYGEVRFFQTPYGTPVDPFSDALTHYNPDTCAHPQHAGDLPPLFGNNGYAFSMFLTNRFSVSEIIGRTVILHSAPDDFTSQPAGNSGVKIACGVIVAP